VQGNNGDVIYCRTPDELGVIAEMLDAGCSVEEIRAELEREPDYVRRACVIGLIWAAAVITFTLAVYGAFKLFGVN